MDEYLKKLQIEVLTTEKSKKSEPTPKPDDKSAFEVFVKDFKKAFQSSFPEPKSFGTRIGSSMGAHLKKAIDSGVATLKSLFKDALAELNTILQYSLVSNEHTRNTMMSYGFSSSQAYGFDKAKSLMGIDSEEDLWYMTSEQWSTFNNMMTKYTEKYNQLYDSGMFSKMLEFQYEMSDFQEEMKLKIVEFVVENKDVIKDGMIAIMDIAKGVLAIARKINAFLGFGSVDTTKSMEIVKNASVTNNSKTSVEVNNTFNNVDRSDQHWLVNAGQQTYQQLIDFFQRS